MNNIILFLIQLMLVTIIILIIIYIYINFSKSKMFLKFKMLIGEIRKREENIFKNKVKFYVLNDKTSTLGLIFLSVFLFILSYIIILKFIKIPLAAIIFSSVFGIFPYLILKLKIEVNKNNIKKSLPIYITNLKSQITVENNIFLAIKRTKPPYVLKKYIDKFILNINIGINEYKALDILSQDVGVKDFSNIISAIKVCLVNGGNFEKVLQIFFNQITWKIEKEEQYKEKYLSSVITLAIMICINIFVLVGYVLNDIQMSNIVCNTIVGRLIVDLDSIACVICMYIIIKICKR